MTVPERTALMSYHESFHAALQRVATDATALYRVAGRVCSMGRRPPSIDHEDHLHDAILVALTVIRDTPKDHRFPLDIDPEYWLVRSVRRSFHSRSYYFREFSWANRRIPGNVNDASESPDDMGGFDASRGLTSAGDSQTGRSREIRLGGHAAGLKADSSSSFYDRRVGGSTMAGLTQDEMLVEDLVDLMPESCHALLRLLAQGATQAQACAILGKKDSWVSWRLRKVREELTKLSQTHKSYFAEVLAKAEAEGVL